MSFDSVLRSRIVALSRAGALTHPPSAATSERVVCRVQGPAGAAGLGARCPGQLGPGRSKFRLNCRRRCPHCIASAWAGDLPKVTSHSLDEACVHRGIAGYDVCQQQLLHHSLMLSAASSRSTMNNQLQARKQQRQRQEQQRTCLVQFVLFGFGCLSGWVASPCVCLFWIVTFAAWGSAQHVLLVF
jgi:hypothetical protein